VLVEEPAVAGIEEVETAASLPSGAGDGSSLEVLTRGDADPTGAVDGASGPVWELPSTSSV
jgi:hypothetical protein